MGRRRIAPAGIVSPGRPSVVLDAGALQSLERRGRRLRALEQLAATGEIALLVSSAVVAQVWRDPARQVPLVRLLRLGALTEHALDPVDARQVGVLLRERSGADVVDAHVAVLARRHDATVVTSDPGDLLRLGVPEQRLQRC